MIELGTPDHMSKLAENYVLGVGFEKESDGFEWRSNQKYEATIAVFGGDFHVYFDSLERDYR